MDIDYGVRAKPPRSSLWHIIGASTGAVVVFVAFVLGAYSTSEVRRLSSDLSSNPSLTLNGKASGKAAVSLYRGAGSWHDQKSLSEANGPGKTSDLQAVAGEDGMIYLFGGIDNSATPVTLNTVTAYDVVRQTYTTKTALSTARAQFGAGAFTDATTGLVTRIIVAGGVSDSALGTATQTSEIYTIATNTVAAGPTLREQHLDGCMASTGDAVYMIGGWKDNYNTHSKTVEKLTRDGTAWTSVADLPEARGDCSAVALNGKVYVAAGYYSESYDASEGFRDTLFVYDPETNAWTQLATMSHARGDLQLVALGNSILAIGGEIFHTRNGAHADKIASHYVEEYYPDKNVWETRALLGNGRFRFGAAVSHWGVHVFGGSEVCDTPTSSSDYTTCYTNQMDSHEVYFELSHPDVWVNFDSSHEY